MPECLNKIENNELEMPLNIYETKGYESVNHQIDLLLEKKFPGVEQSSKDVDIPDEHTVAKSDAHMDDQIYEEVGVERKLKFKDINQKNEFLKLVEVLKGPICAEQEQLLKEIGY